MQFQEIDCRAKKHLPGWQGWSGCTEKISQCVSKKGGRVYSLSALTYFPRYLALSCPDAFDAFESEAQRRVHSLQDGAAKWRKADV